MLTAVPVWCRRQNRVLSVMVELHVTSHDRLQRLASLQHSASPSPCGWTKPKHYRSLDTIYDRQHYRQTDERMSVTEAWPHYVRSAKNYCSTITGINRWSITTRKIWECDYIWIWIQRSIYCVQSVNDDDDDDDDDDRLTYRRMSVSVKHSGVVGHKIRQGRKLQLSSRKDYGRSKCSP